MKIYASNIISNIVTLADHFIKHDVCGHVCRAEGIYQNMKSTYGLSACHLLMINSRSLDATGDNIDNDQANIPNPWTQFLTRKSDYQVGGVWIMSLL